MRSLREISVVLVFSLVGPCLMGADKDQEAKDKAKAALALARAAREREKNANVIPKAKGYAEAVEAAKKAKKPLVIWVGIEAKDHPEVYEKLKGPALNMRLDEYSGSKMPRIYYSNDSLTVYYFEEKALNATVIDIISKTWPKKDSVDGFSTKPETATVIAQEK